MNQHTTDTAGSITGLMISLASACWAWVGDNSDQLAVVGVFAGLLINWYYLHKKDRRGASGS